MSQQRPEQWNQMQLERLERLWLDPEWDPVAGYAPPTQEEQWKATDYCNRKK